MPRNAVGTSRASEGRRREEIGVVTSDKMDKTVVVQVERAAAHPVYTKIVRSRRKFVAHDENNECNIGDRVRIVESRPLSARKRWRVVEVLQKAPAA